MIIVADSGSTKTEWVSNSLSVTTKGINPVRDTKEEILEVLTTELMPKLYPIGNDHETTEEDKVTEIHFYGAGCIEPFSQTVREALMHLFPRTRIHVYSDLLGAARALCGKSEGIACILGTGSNSCLCNGGEILSNVSPLGYILGDEGSGAVLGRTLVAEMQKGGIKDLWQAFHEEYGITMPDIINKVYRQPQANKFLASLVPFIKKHIHRPSVRKMVVDEFCRFLERNVKQYERPDLEVNFVGGIANNFIPEIQAACEHCNLKIGRIIARPAEDMYKYHIYVI